MRVRKENDHGDDLIHSGLQLISDFSQPPSLWKEAEDELSFLPLHKENNTQDTQRGTTPCSRSHSQDMADSEAQVLPTPKSVSVFIYQAKQGLGSLVAFQVGDAVPTDGCLPATTGSARATSQLLPKKSCKENSPHPTPCSLLTLFLIHWLGHLSCNPGEMFLASLKFS